MTSDERPGARTPWVLGLTTVTAFSLLLWTSQRFLGGISLFLAAWLLSRALPERRARRATGAVLALLVALWIFQQARWVVYPLVAGLLTASALEPAVDWMERRRIRRPLAAVLALLPILLVVTLALVFLIPAIVDQIQLLIEKLPGAYAWVAGKLQGVARGLEPAGRERPPLAPAGVPFLPDTAAVPGAGAALDSAGHAAPAALAAAEEAGRLDPAAADTAGAAVRQAADSARAGAGTGRTVLPLGAQLLEQIQSLLYSALGKLSDVGRGLGKAAQWIGLLALTPVIAFHLLIDWNLFRETVYGWVPDRWHPVTRRLSAELRTSIQVYVRGQALVAGIETVLFAIVFAIAGLPSPVALGFLAGLFSLIPILGFWLTVAVVALNCLVVPGPWAALLKAGIGLAVINVVEGQFLVPRIQGTGLGLHPLVVLLGVLLFGTLFGFAGVILAVPVLGVLKALLPEMHAAWRHTDSFRGDDAAEAADPPAAGPVDGRG